MLNHILSALGLPKRTEINTTQTPALRRIAGLEDDIEGIVERELETMLRLSALQHHYNELEKAVVQMRMILDDMQPKPVKPVKPARKTVRRAKP